MRRIKGGSVFLKWVFKFKKSTKTKWSRINILI